MHAAPSVTYPVGRSAFAAQAQACAALAGLAATCAWAWQSDAFGWRQALAFAAVAACSALALAAWRRAPAGMLRWDGLAWTSEHGGSVGAGRPDVALDLQSRLLLRWSADGGGTRWYWVERLSDPAHWEALRRAVYSRASTPLPPAGEPPAAEQ
jgi:toxin CptA